LIFHSFQNGWLRKKSENVLFRHSRENGNPVFSIAWQVLDSRLRGNDDFLRDHQDRWLRKKLQLQGAQKLRSEAHLHVHRSDEGAAQRRRWTFYETIRIPTIY
jgi:hypothetical protein